jgi:hypothetical protein
VITSKRLAQVARTTLVLPFLLAALLGLGIHASAVHHASVSVSAHQGIAYDDPPPSH